MNIEKSFGKDYANTLFLWRKKFLSNWEEISKDKPVYVHCRSGKRSAAVIDSLERGHGFDNLHNLTGGILAYASEVDTSLEKY